MITRAIQYTDGRSLHAIKELVGEADRASVTRIGIEHQIPTEENPLEVVYLWRDDCSHRLTMIECQDWICELAKDEYIVLSDKVYKLLLKNLEEAVEESAHELATANL